MLWPLLVRKMVKTLEQLWTSRLRAIDCALTILATVMTKLYHEHYLHFENARKTTKIVASLERDPHRRHNLVLCIICLHGPALSRSHVDYKAEIQHS